jgi:hypothetical protein
MSLANMTSQAVSSPPRRATVVPVQMQAERSHTACAAMI